MNLNSAVKMLPQEVKTPLVPDSGMCTESSTAEVKRKAGPDALAAPDAKKRATAGLPREDKTPLEGTVLSQNDKDVLHDEESDTSDNDELYIYDTYTPHEMESLEEVVALAYDPSNPTYDHRCAVLGELQESYAKKATDSGYFGMLHVEVLLNEEGELMTAMFSGK